MDGSKHYQPGTWCERSAFDSTWIRILQASRSEINSSEILATDILSFVSKCGLEEGSFSGVWAQISPNTSTLNSSNVVRKPEFYSLMRGIALAQNGYPHVTMENLLESKGMDIPLPRFHSWAYYPLSSSERSAYDALWLRFNISGKLSIIGSEMLPFVSTSGLSRDILIRCWRVSQNGRMRNDMIREEFYVFMRCVAFVQTTGITEPTRENIMRTAHRDFPLPSFDERHSVFSNRAHHEELRDLSLLKLCHPLVFYFPRSVCESSAYEELWRRASAACLSPADTAKNPSYNAALSRNRITATAALSLAYSSSHLTPSIIDNIWQICCTRCNADVAMQGAHGPAGEVVISREQFHVLLRGIALAQQFPGQVVTVEAIAASASQDVALPDFDGVLDLVAGAAVEDFHREAVQNGMPNGTSQSASAPMIGTAQLFQSQSHAQPHFVQQPQAISNNQFSTEAIPSAMSIPLTGAGHHSDGFSSVTASFNSSIRPAVSYDSQPSAPSSSSAGIATATANSTPTNNNLLNPNHDSSSFGSSSSSGTGTGEYSPTGNLSNAGALGPRKASSSVIPPPRRKTSEMQLLSSAASPNGAGAGAGTGPSRGSSSRELTDLPPPLLVNYATVGAAPMGIAGASGTMGQVLSDLARVKISSTHTSTGTLTSTEAHSSGLTGDAALPQAHVYMQSTVVPIASVVPMTGTQISSPVPPPPPPQTMCVCGDSVSLSINNTVRLRCKCLIHAGCLAQYIKSQLDDSSNITSKGIRCCYWHTCHCYISMDDVQKFSQFMNMTSTDDTGNGSSADPSAQSSSSSSSLKDADVEKLQRFSVAATFNHKDLVYCPKCSVPFWVEESFTAHRVICANAGCGIHFCRYCQVKWHLGMECEEYQASMGNTERMSQAFITATSKPCPSCATPFTHFHGHSCHHISPVGPQGGGCPACHKHFCYACLATEEENVAQRGDRKSCRCARGKWSTFCESKDIQNNLIAIPYPHDQRCGCPICPDCRYQRPCGGANRGGASCDGSCVVCLGLVAPGPAELRYS